MCCFCLCMHCSSMCDCFHIPTCLCVLACIYPADKCSPVSMQMFACGCVYLPYVFVCQELSCVCLCKCLFMIAICFVCFPLHAHMYSTCKIHLLMCHPSAPTAQSELNFILLACFFTFMCCFLFPMFGMTHFCCAICIPALHLLCMCLLAYVHLCLSLLL